MSENITLDELIEAARRLGCDTPERVIDRLWRMIVRNKNYVERRQKRGNNSAFNEVVAEDTAALAMAIKLLQDKGGQQDEH